MEAEHVLRLYDSCWFEHQILKETPKSSSNFETNPHDQIKQDSPKPKLSRMESNHTRSMSDSMASLKLDSFSPDSVLLPNSKLQTILSVKEVTDPEKEIEIENPTQSTMGMATRRRRKKKGESKSLSDLEFEELKGFMDLGFVFSEEDKDSTLASIIPGLHRLGKKDEDKYFGHDTKIRRPYLSEAWKVQERRKKRENPLMNWKVPSQNNEIDMKDSLKWWAHTVASTVR
ncbi:uncharacterized protein G2W53_002644 [Senna tora]|uniref:Uncharacterized protein n=1 Tax=Senna tora TaxID=362788 RepID=A0A835CG57_9FABA|nr:uncharacterized protein G2W53_002644 [Senna tora]